MCAMAATDVDAFLSGPLVHAAVGASAGTKASVLAPEADAEEQLGTLRAQAAANAAAALDAAVESCVAADEAASAELVELINQHVHRGEYTEAVLLVSELAAASRFRLATEEVGAGSRASRAGTATAPASVTAAGAAQAGPDADAVKYVWWGVQGTPSGPPPGVSVTQLEKLQRSMDKVAQHYSEALAAVPPATAAFGDRHMILAALFTVLPPRLVWPLYVRRRRRDLAQLASLAPRSLASLRRLGATVVECARADAGMLTGSGSAARDGLTFANVASLPVLLESLLLGVYSHAAT